jgi:Mn2+/Fe2+ NRAMP family transporter
MALLAANTINIAADLAGMADAAEMLSGVKAHFFVVVFALLISWATIRLQYRQIANVLKWLVLVLFAYPITAFVVGIDWSEVVRATLVPSMPRTCFSGKRVRRLKRKRQRARVRLPNEGEQHSKNLN